MIKKRKNKQESYLDSWNSNLPQSLSKNDPIGVLGLPTRLENTLTNKGKIMTVGGFYNFPNKKICRVRNIGEKSERFLFNIKKEVGKRIDNATTQKSCYAELSRKELVDFLIGRCGNDRLKDVILRRYGLLSGDKETLEEIGRSYGVTRERVRQLHAKALKRLRHPSNKARRPIIELADDLLWSKDALLSDEEAEKCVPAHFENNDIWGSSFLRMLTDLGWIQSYKLGDIVLYLPKDLGPVEGILSQIFNILKRSRTETDTQSILKRATLLGKVEKNGFNKIKFINRYCLMDPRIERLDRIRHTVSESGLGAVMKFCYFSPRSHMRENWVSLMKFILEEEGTPLHFTEIANKVNDHLEKPDHRLDHRRAHSILIEDPKFAHSGIRGTYGLIKWGLRKKSTPDLVTECLEKAGFPLHWKQVFYYVGKYKDSRKESIHSILENKQRFVKKGPGIYWLKDA